MEDNKISKYTANTFGYYVEARFPYRPVTFAGVALGDKWTRLHFHDGSAVGVPIGASFEEPILKMVGLLSYPAAQALRWWFHATANLEGGAFGLETRIVKCAISYSYEVTKQSEHLVIGGEDRSSIMPDWGVKKETEKAGE